MRKSVELVIGTACFASLLYAPTVLAAGVSPESTPNVTLSINKKFKVTNTDGKTKSTTETNILDGSFHPGDKITPPVEQGFMPITSEYTVGERVTQTFYWIYNAKKAKVTIHFIDDKNGKEIDPKITLVKGTVKGHYKVEVPDNVKNSHYQILNQQDTSGEITDENQDVVLRFQSLKDESDDDHSGVDEPQTPEIVDDNIPPAEKDPTNDDATQTDNIVGVDSGTSSDDLNDHEDESTATEEDVVTGKDESTATEEDVVTSKDESTATEEDVVTGKDESTATEEDVVTGKDESTATEKDVATGKDESTMTNTIKENNVNDKTHDATLNFKLVEGVDESGNILFIKQNHNYRNVLPGYDWQWTELNHQDGIFIAHFKAKMVPVVIRHIDANGHVLAIEKDTVPYKENYLASPKKIAGFRNNQTTKLLKIDKLENNEITFAYRPDLNKANRKLSNKKQTTKTIKKNAKKTAKKTVKRHPKRHHKVTKKSVKRHRKTGTKHLKRQYKLTRKQVDHSDKTKHRSWSSKSRSKSTQHRKHATIKHKLKSSHND